MEPRDDTIKSSPLTILVTYYTTLYATASGLQIAMSEVSDPDLRDVFRLLYDDNKDDWAFSDDVCTLILSSRPLLLRRISYPSNQVRLG